VVQKGLYWDLTAAKVYSLSPQSVKVAHALKAPTRVLAFYSQQAPELATVEELVLRYRQHTSLLSFEVVNPISDVARVSKYQIQDDGPRVVLVQSNLKSESTERFQVDLADFDHEQRFTQALMRLGQSRGKTIYFTQGHGERSPEQLSAQGLSELKKALEGEGFKVQNLSLRHGLEMPQQAAAIIVAGPQTAFDASEIEKLGSYLANGGQVGIALEPGMSGGLDGLLGRYGIQVNRDVVIDRAEMGQLVGQGPTTAVALNYPTQHPITQGLRGAATIFPGASSISLNPGGEGVTQILAQTDAKTWGEKKLLSGMTQEGVLRYDPGEVQGPINLMVASTKAESRLWVSGDVDFMSDAAFHVSANKNLVLNAMSWLGKAEQNMGIRSHRRGHHRLVLTPAQKEYLAFVLVYLWPLLCLFIGIGVTQYRRYRFRRHS